MSVMFRRLIIVALLLGTGSTTAFANYGPFVPGAPQTITTRPAPRSVATGDIDHDGILDLMVSSAGGFSFHKGLGGGSFAPRVDYGISGPCGNAVLADFNFDGNLDVVAPARVSAFPGPVTMRGVGDGTFGPPDVWSGPANEDFLVVDDFNNDGKPDFATCGYATSAGTASVYLNTTTVSGGLLNFARTDYAVGTKPAGIAAGHLKSSPPYKDLVIANYGAGTITILQNNGTGHFINRQDITVKQSVYAVTVADFYDGGFFPEEIVTANKDSSSVSYMLSDQVGGWNRWEFPTAASPRDVIVADAVGDGQKEILAACFTGNKISILQINPLGFGSTGFLPKNDIATGTGPLSASVVNFNGDIKNDVLSANQTAGSLTYTPGLIGNSWSYGDFVPGDFSAPNQFGDVTNFSGLRAGKWVLLEICSTWCHPCRLTAEHTQDLYLRWAGNPNVQFEYVTALVDGRFPGTPSSVNDAMAWANTFHINRPILHSAGSPSGGARNLAAITALTATPTLRLIDPQGQIRWYSEGSSADSTVTRVLANLAGVAIPPPVAPSINVGFAGGTMVVLHGNQSALAPYEPDFGEFPFYDYGVGFYDNLIGTPTVTRDASGLETWKLTLRYNEVGLSGIAYEPLPTNDFWKFNLSNIALDALNRVPANGSLASVTVKDSVNNFNTQYYEAQVRIPYTWSNSGTFTMDPIPADKLAELPPIREVTVIWTLKVGNIVTGAADGKPAHLALRAPFPNPAVNESRLEWSQPRAGMARLELYDVRGRLVKTLAHSVQPAGEHGARWDLTDENGTRVGAGLYFARVAVEGMEAETARVTVLR